MQEMENASLRMVFPSASAAQGGSRIAPCNEPAEGQTVPLKVDPTSIFSSEVTV